MIWIISELPPPSETMPTPSSTSSSMPARRAPFSLFLTDYFIMGSMFKRRLSFFNGISISEYFIGKSGAFCGLILLNAYESQITIIPINKLKTKRGVDS